MLVWDDMLFDDVEPIDGLLEHCAELEVTSKLREAMQYPVTSNLGW